MTNERFHQLFGLPPRRPDECLTQAHMNVAASIQAVLEEVVLKLTRSLAQETGARDLCLAGGVALNCVANGKVLRDGRFARVWIQPAAGDAGGAIGAALCTHYGFLGNPRAGGTYAMRGAYLGPEFSDRDIEARLTQLGAKVHVLAERELLDRVADDLTSGAAVGWFQGRMEFGPRALGARSILGDPRSPTMQKLLNLKVKYRESFRPFAPAILEEHVKEFFEIEIPSPYMLLVMPIREERRRNQGDNAAASGLDKLRVPRSDVPAVTHVDYSVRLQTVTPERSPMFARIIEEFYKLTGCPMIVNTSFNVRGEPIVCDHEDAYRCFLMTDIDILVLDNCVVAKSGVDLEEVRAHA